MAQQIRYALSPTHTSIVLCSWLVGSLAVDAGAATSKRGSIFHARECVS